MQFSWLPKAQKIVWAIFLLTLPVTSFPFFPGGVGGRTEVRPLSLYPLVVLVLLVTIPRLFSRPIPRTAFPLAAFGLAAIASTAFAFTQGIDPDIGISLSSRTIRMLVTLVIGIAFYITVAVTPTSRQEMRFSLRWLYGGFVMALLWGSIQISYILFYTPEFFAFIEHLQGFISVRGLFETRISGMTYEPNWFAEQITFLLMPWLFAAVLSNYTAFRWRFRWLTIEMLLLAWASIVLIYTYSRTGYVLWFVQLILAFLFRPRRISEMGKSWGLIAKRVLQVGVLVVAIGLVVFVAGSRNPYFSRLWNYFSDEDAVGSYIQYIAVSQRIAYWETAYHIYEEFPWMGIGLGNYTFYFEEKLSDRPLFPTPELLRKFTPADGSNRVVVPKNFFVRILAETGLLGTAAFLAFLVAVLGCSLYLYMASHPEARFLGQAGLLSLVVFLGVAFSVDSFASPNMWVLFGLITASAQIFSQPSAIEYG